MQIEPVTGEGLLLVQSYRPGGFTIAGARHQGAVLVTPERVAAWAVASVEDITAASLEALRAAEPPIDLLILGMGAGFRLLAPALKAELRGWGIASEAMATPAACRTYNLLALEGRRVAAALIAMP
jgi:uncharacterized protein